MLRLYKKQGGRVTTYHEAWIDGSYVTEHWGGLGEHGQTKTHKRDRKQSDDANIVAVLEQAVKNGFAPISLEDHAVLVVEYAVKGMGTPKDLVKRHKLEERLNETLGWTGLGNCDGGSIGSGTMEVVCFVVDFDIAKRVIEADLAGTQFGDFSRIYREDTE